MRYFKKIIFSKWFIILTIFALHVFLRFYQLDSRLQFTWDQVDSAWAAKNIIVDHRFPLTGVPVKLNSGLHVGPLYYYLVAIFYSLTNLDPIASGILAGVVSVFTFLVLFYVAYKLFTFNIALFAVLIYSVSWPQISLMDRVQWTVNFIPSLSLLIFYFLFRVLKGEEKYIVLLLFTIGIFFHVHIAAIMFPIIMFLTLPLFPKTARMLKFTVVAIFAFLLWLIPNIVVLLQNKAQQVSVLAYFNTFYQGIHLRRILQLTNDAHVQFEKFLIFPQLLPLKYILVPVFFFIYLLKSLNRERLIFCYSVLLWFIVPWVILSTYRGELSDYYFSINSFVALLVITYIVGRIWEINSLIPKFVIACSLVYYVIFNLNIFFRYNYFPLPKQRQEVLRAIKEGRKIQFQEGAPESYLYYYYTRIKKQ